MPAGAHVFNLVIPTTHGRPISADVRLPDTGLPAPLVVFVHGFKGFKDWGHFNVLAAYFAARGFGFAKLNLSHNGTTPDHLHDLTDMEAFAENNFSKELSDIRNFIDFLTSSPAALPSGFLQPDQLFLIGHSRGGSVAILAAAEDERIKAVASWAAVSNLEKRWTPQELEQWKAEGVEYILNMRTGQQLPLNYQIVEDFMANKERFSVEQAASRLGNRLLLVHGDKDDAVPVNMAHDLAKANPDATLLVLPGCDHSFGGAHPFTKSELPAFAAQTADATMAFFRRFAHA